MSSFLNSTQLSLLTGTFQNHFDTFSSGINNYVTIYKEPLQVIQNPDSQSIFGYSSDTTVNSNSDITYQNISATYPAMIIYPGDPKELAWPQIKTSLSTNEIMIKVKSDAKDYIVNGKTERIVANGVSYNIQTTPKIQNYFGSLYYYFKCVETQ